MAIEMNMSLSESTQVSILVNKKIFLIFVFNNSLFVIRKLYYKII